MAAQQIASVIRGETVESVHNGHVSIVDGDGKTVFEHGEPSTVTYFRSACKAFQAIPFITSGAADAFLLTGDEVAVAVASHSGEPVHVSAVQRMLTKIGLSESDLKCGSHWPFSEAETHRMLAAGEKPTQLHNNCSGKHAAMLAFAKHIGADLATYDAPDNRIQKRILRAVADFTEIPEDQVAIGVDGCAAPNFALPISAMARAFANLVDPVRFPEITRNACARISSAMTRFPELIGGSTRLDTMLMRAAPERIVSKVGADGVWLCGIMPCEQYPTGLGVALKVADGDDNRARPAVAVEVLRRLGILTSGDLTDLSPMLLKNRRGDIVGRVVPTIGL
jgi:L-asparaginase II